MKVVVTGAGGFVGAHVVPALRELGHEVIAWRLGDQPGPLASSSRCVDLTRRDQIVAGLNSDRPERVIHLAAFSDVGASLRSAARVWSVNTLATVNLADALVQVTPGCPLVFAGSGDSYGATFNKHRPVTERHRLRPLNPYSASKAAAEVALSQYHRSAGLPVILVRSFNCAGPGQRTGFVVSDFSRQVAMIEAGLQAATIGVGNLNASRDFVDVRDAAKAYALLAQLPAAQYQGQAINLCSGFSRPIRTVVEQLIALSQKPIKTATDPDRLRPSDVPIALGDPSRLTALTHWTAVTDFQVTLRDTLEDWRRRVAARD